MKPGWSFLIGLLLLVSGSAARAADTGQNSPQEALRDEVTNRRIESQLLHRKLTLSGLRPWLNGAPIAGGPPAGDLMLVHLWATWCAPCLAELPRLKDFFASLRTHVATERVRVSMVSDDQDPEALRKFFRSGQAIPAVDQFHNTNGLFRRSLQAPEVLPITLLLDNRLVVRDAFLGSLEARRNELLYAAEKLGATVPGGGCLAARPAAERKSASSARHGLSISTGSAPPAPTWEGEAQARLVESALLHYVLDVRGLGRLHGNGVVSGSPETPSGWQLVAILTPGCTGCAREMPILSAIAAALPAGRLLFVGLVGADEQSEFARFIKQQRELFPKAEAYVAQVRAKDRRHAALSVLSCDAGNAVSRQAIGNVHPYLPALLKAQEAPILLLVDSNWTIRQAVIGSLFDRRTELVESLERAAGL